MAHSLHSSQYQPPGEQVHYQQPVVQQWEKTNCVAKVTAPKSQLLPDCMFYLRVFGVGCCRNMTWHSPEGISSLAGMANFFATPEVIFRLGKIVTCVFSREWQKVKLMCSLKVFWAFGEINHASLDFWEEKFPPLKSLINTLSSDRGERRKKIHKFPFVEVNFFQGRHPVYGGENEREQRTSSIKFGDAKQSTEKKRGIFGATLLLMGHFAKRRTRRFFYGFT